MERTLKRPNGSVFVSLTFIPEEEYIFVGWDGYLDLEMVKQGSEELLAMIEETKSQKTLICNKKITGPWNKANSWYAASWNPRAKKAGLKYMAVVVSDNIFAQLSLQGFEKVCNGNYSVFCHNDAEVAREWLLNQNKTGRDSINGQLHYSYPTTPLTCNEDAGSVLQPVSLYTI
ncbi:hypothetical protein [Cesiribacter sp. SM1]|uniref:hypothetical protein n=1 Tax=Cesiribacter sp. SM1 TaxID=2861196 RepID=UPI001CD74CA2|nr:hypothetical protein [Cesiribacter sp. SM1]